MGLLREAEWSCGAEDGDRPDHFDVDGCEGIAEDLAQPVFGVREVVEAPSAVGPRSTTPDNHVCSAGVPSTVAPKSTPSGSRTAATLRMAAALRDIGPGRQCST